MDNIKQNSFRITKLTLIAITIVNLIVYIVGSLLIREELDPYYEEEWKDFGLDKGMVHKLINFAYVVAIIFLLVHIALFLYFIKENLIGVLVITILTTLSFLYGLTSIDRNSGFTITDIILTIIEISLGFYFSYLLNNKAKNTNSQLNKA